MDDCLRYQLHSISFLSQKNIEAVHEGKCKDEEDQNLFAWTKWSSSSRLAASKSTSLPTVTFDIDKKNRKLPWWLNSLVWLKIDHVGANLSFSLFCYLGTYLHVLLMCCFHLSIKGLLHYQLFPTFFTCKLHIHSFVLISHCNLNGYLNSYWIVGCIMGCYLPLVYL